jgi:hypothetical protein
MQDFWNQNHGCDITFQYKQAVCMQSPVSRRYIQLVIPHRSTSYSPEALPTARCLSEVNPRELALHATKPLRTLPTKCHTPTPHITDLGLCTSSIRAIWRLDATLPLKSIESTHQSMICQHCLCHSVPVCCIKGCGGGPGDWIGSAGRILVREDRAVRVGRV